MAITWGGVSGKFGRAGWIAREKVWGVSLSMAWSKTARFCLGKLCSVSVQFGEWRSLLFSIRIERMLQISDTTLTNSLAGGKGVVSKRNHPLSIITSGPYPYFCFSWFRISCIQQPCSLHGIELAESPRRHRR